MDGINLVPAVVFLGKDGFEYLEQPVVVMIIPKITLEFPNQYSRYCPQFPVCLKGLAAILGMISETLVAIDTFQDKSITLAKRKLQFMHGVKNLVQYLFMQLRISRKGDILFLDDRIDKGCIVMMVVVIPVIHTDAFLENEFNTLFTDTVAEMNQFGSGTWGSGSKLLQSAEILLVSIFTPLFHYGFIRQITKMFED